MEIAYREYGDWGGPDLEVRLSGGRLLVEDGLPRQLTAAELTAYAVLAQRVLDAEDEFGPAPVRIADPGFRELAIEAAPGRAHVFVVRDATLAPPPFEALAQRLAAAGRAIGSGR